ncbi:MAG: mucoidy inhibitor MuiA family protein [Phycisphaeraceae bacterium]|nr:mucoidy inhibitor MuiA family protein [Phycisphaeraceae bacterium]
MTPTGTDQPETDLQPPGPRTVRLEAPVVSVTVMEDRAQVRRRGRVRLSAGRTRLRIEEVTPLVADKTLRVSGHAGGGLSPRVEEVRIHRWIDTDDQQRQDQEADCRDQLGSALEELSIATQEKTCAHHWLEGLQALQEQLIADIRSDASWGRDLRQQWRGDLKNLIDRIAEATDRHSLSLQRLSDVQQRVDGLRARLESLGPSEKGARTARLEMDCVIEEGGTYEINIDYLVPNACWRPQHTARLQQGPDGPRLGFQTDACLWQYTGEDWSDVTLSFSTLRPSTGRHAPVLQSERLESQKRQDLVVEKPEPKIHTTGLGVESVAARGLPGVEDRGRTFHQEAARTHHIPSDGRPRRVRLFSFETDAQTELVCKPELARTVILLSAQTNDSDHPLLAGPVDLIRECGRIGQATMHYTATGERFELGWGPQDVFRAHRHHRKVPKDMKLVGNWDATEHHITVTLSNLGPESATVRLVERLPVSEVDAVQVQIDSKKTSAGHTLQPNGMANWSLMLPPHHHETVELSYLVRRESGNRVG